MKIMLDKFWVKNI